MRTGRVKVICPAVPIPDLLRDLLTTPGPSGHEAPAAAVWQMTDAILNDRKRILPCAAYLQGQYGVKGLFVGVPVKLGAKGIEQIYQIKLTEEEKGMLAKSAASVQELVDILKTKI